MARRKGSHTSRVGSDKLHPDYIEHSGITSQEKRYGDYRDDVLLTKYDHPDETMLHYLGCTVDAMRVARSKGRGRPKAASAGVSSAGAHEDECSGLGMPKPCWEAFQRHILVIATKLGLEAKIKERCFDSIGVVYVEFFRKEKT